MCYFLFNVLFALIRTAFSSFENLSHLKPKGCEDSLDLLCVLACRRPAAAVTDLTAQRWRSDLLLAGGRPFQAVAQRHRLTPHPRLMGGNMVRPLETRRRLELLFAGSSPACPGAFLSPPGHYALSLFVGPKVEEGRSIVPRAGVDVHAGARRSG